MEATTSHLTNVFVAVLFWLATGSAFAQLSGEQQYSVLLKTGGSVCLTGTLMLNEEQLTEPGPYNESITFSAQNTCGATIPGVATCVVTVDPNNAAKAESRVQEIACSSRIPSNLGFSMFNSGDSRGDWDATFPGSDTPSDLTFFVFNVDAAVVPVVATLPLFLMGALMIAFVRVCRKASRISSSTTS